MKPVILILVLFFSDTLWANKNTDRVYYEGETLSIGTHVNILQDASNSLTLQDVVKSTSFVINDKPAINLGVSNSTFWIKFTLTNNSEENYLLLNLEQSALNNIEVFTQINKTSFSVRKFGTSLPFHNREYNNQNFIFKIKALSDESKQIFIKIQCNTQITIPITVGSEKQILEHLTNKDLLFGIFFGIVFCMFFYNLFVYFTVKDHIYQYYVLYIFSVTLSQCTLQGYGFRFLWPHSVWLSQNGIFIFTNLGGICACFFTKKFLHTKFYLPRLTYVLDFLIGIFLLSLSFFAAGKEQWSFTIMQTNTLIAAVCIIVLALIILKKGYKPAKFFFVAWLSVCLGAATLVLKDFNLFPVTTFTSGAFEIGIGIEVIVLAFALADKINVYKKEKEEMQAQALRVSKENEKLIQEQNIVLEKQVAQRTHDLEKTLHELKDAQVQLVESEKMASLGQLTAGIAHEINNPINFVKSNVSPLNMDVQDLFELITEYQKLHVTGSGELTTTLQQIKTLENRLDPDFLKEEIESLIGGIEEGAERTAEIVRGLRIFSRLDESEMKEVNIYDNINSTLILLRNATPHYLKMRKHFEARGEIECYPGKLNQVFMNILTNCIQAIKAKAEKNEEEYIDIFVTEVEECMRIEIADTGIGMTEEVKRKIFDPFFTTKDVGEGTGLGMSIVFKIIEKHHGKISVHSIPGNGATFTIEIPYMLKAVSALAVEEPEMIDEELETE